MIHKFEQRFLNTTHRTNQFSVFTHTGKNIEWLEKDGYKVFNFIQKRFGLTLKRLVTDWVKDKNGVVWLVAVKSFDLNQDSWKRKIARPTPKEKEAFYRGQNRTVPKT